jgi:arsenite methyltransferase
VNARTAISGQGAEASIYERYANAASHVEQALCCPVEYSADFLSVIPAEILDRDYGCGNPTPLVNEHETVLDLGSGGGKLCYILAQVVGKRGRVIGVDCNQEMLALARRHQETIAERLGFGNVDFRYGLIQDLRLDLDLLGRELRQHPVRDPADWLALRHHHREAAARAMADGRGNRIPLADSCCLQRQARPMPGAESGRHLSRPLQKGRGRRRPCLLSWSADGRLR